MALIGIAFVLAALFVFTYCSTWIFIVPFIEENHCLKKYFLDINYLTYGPIILLILAFIFIASFLYIKTRASKKNK